MKETFAPRPQRDRLTTLEEKGGKRMAAALIAALGLHIGAVIEPKVEEAFKQSYIYQNLEHRKGEEKGKAKSIQPQSKEDLQATIAAVEERLQRIDHAALDRYKAWSSKKLEQGEDMSFHDLYFTLEQLNGIPSEEVEQAKRNAKKLITRYAKEMKRGKFDETFINYVVNDLYGPKDNEKKPVNYRWNQGSISRAFNSDIYNCVSISGKQIIVQEGLIRLLPKEEQKRWQLGKTIMKQHVIANLVKYTQSGLPQMLMLETQPENAPLISLTEEDPGTAFIGADLIKRGLVAEKPIVVKAKTGKVTDSPNLNIATDQPVSDGIIVDAERLKGSDFVMHQTSDKLLGNVHVPAVDERNRKLDKHERIALTTSAGVFDLELNEEKREGAAEGRRLLEEALRSDRP